VCVCARELPGTDGMRVREAAGGSLPGFAQSYYRQLFPERIVFTLA
jgi:hypothetical protein